MSERLREHTDDLSALVGRTASALGLPETYVEKDFWVTEVLRASAVDREINLRDGRISRVTFIFKGGTSLSRVFGILDRFSEDVDLLAVFPEGATDSAKHNVLKRVDQDVTAHLNLTKDKVEVGPSTKGVKRYTTYPYPVDTPHEGLSEGVLLELGSRGGSSPSTSHPYQSMIAAHAIADLGDSEDIWEEFASFEVNVLAPERTLLEKIAAVHDAAERNDTTQLARHGRHFYDIDRLLNTPSVIAALQTLESTGVAELVEDISVHSKKAGFSWTPRPETGYADSAAFDPTHLSHEAILASYQQAQSLVHGERISFEQVLNTVAANRELL